VLGSSATSYSGAATAVVVAGITGFGITDNNALDRADQDTAGHFAILHRAILNTPLVIG
jgi:hypothetical protein